MSRPIGLLTVVLVGGAVFVGACGGGATLVEQDSGGAGPVDSGDPDATVVASKDTGTHAEATVVPV